MDKESKKELNEAIKLIEKANTISDGNIGHALIKLYRIKQSDQK